MDYSIEGIGKSQISFVEYYSYSVMNDFETYAKKIQTAYTNVKNAIDANQTPSPTDYDNLIQALQSMAELAKNGRQDSNGVDTYQSYMTQEMAQVLTSVTTTLSFAGITASSSTDISDAEKMNLLTQWINTGKSSGINIGQNITTAASFVANLKEYVVQVKQSGTGKLVDLNVIGSPTLTLQSMLGLEYIATGNNMMATHMNDLQQALSLSKSTLQTLQVLQNIANQITVKSPASAFRFPPVNLNFDSSVNGYGVQSLKNMSDIEKDVFKAITDSKAPGNAVANAFAAYFPQLSADTQKNVLSKLGITTISQLTSNSQLNRIDMKSYYQVNSIVAAAIQDYQRYIGPVGNLVTDKAMDKTKDFSRLYKVMASAYFVQLYPSASVLTHSVSAILTVRAQLQQQLIDVQQRMLNVPASTRPLMSNLNESLKSVLNGLNQVFSGVPATDLTGLTEATRKWILDSQSATGSEGVPGAMGKNATALQSAITNAESLEQRQKEDVQSYLYVFQEFYNTAGAMLKTLSEMIQKMIENFSNKH